MTPRSLSPTLIAILFAASTSACAQDSSNCIPTRPVVFVHGSGLDSSTWKPMYQAFIGAGYPEGWLKALDLVPNDGSSILAAEQQIASVVRMLLEEAARSVTGRACPKPGKVDIVAHSMGAMSARWYAARIGPQRVRNLIAIAPANHGSNSLCGLNGAGNRELCPAFAQDRLSHRLQTTLNGTTADPADETPYGLGIDGPGRPTVEADALRHISYTVIRLDPDEWIRPSRSAVLDGAGGLTLISLPADAILESPGNVLWCSEVSHDDLPKDERLIRVVLSSLLEDDSQ